MRLAWYGATVFLSSALLLVLEIVAGRLIAPYVGVSLYTWTSIIGVILAGLSLGNWLGGRWADRGGKETAVGITLALSGLTSLAILLLLTLVAPLIQGSGMNLLGASFLFVLSLFFLPAVLLGVVTPLLTTLALGLDSRAGHVVGRMHALAALGSILGTFAAGYWLIQSYGTRSVVVGSAIALLVLSLPFFFARRSLRAPAAIAVAALAVAGLTGARGGFLEPCDRESQYYCLRVVDVSRDVPLFGRAHALVLDHLLHGINHQSEAQALISPYVHLMDELARNHLGPNAATASYFFAGGGAYTHPRALRARAPEARVVVAELDPAVTELARERLFVDTSSMEVVHQDARLALRERSEERFDVVVGDVFHDVAVPYHLTTLEYARLIKQRLADEGLYVMNVVDAHPDPLLVKSLYKTLAEAFAHVHVWLEALPQAPDRVTYVISASDREPPERITAQSGFPRTWQRLPLESLAAGTPLDALPVLTDDFVPVDKLVSRLIVSGLGH